MIHVTAAVIIRGDDVLICRRGTGGSCSGLWEFPGGKLEPGESGEQCIIRECLEELGIDIRVTGVFSESVFQYPEREISFTFFSAEIMRGEPVRHVHTDIRWARRDDLTKYPFCPADESVVALLGSPVSGRSVL